MRVLLDTSSFIFFISGSRQLSTTARELMEDFGNKLFMSVASLWEMAIKINTGKLELTEPFERIIPEKLEENDIKILQIKTQHLFRLIKLPFHHRDPFDRLILAQGLSEKLPIISPDRAFHAYPVEIIW